MRRFDLFRGVLARGSSKILIAALSVALLGGAGCAIEPGDEDSEIGAAPRVAAEPGRSFVFELEGDTLRTLRSDALAEAPRAPRQPPAAWAGHFEILDDDGRVLADGAFRLPERVHALFAAVDGEAEPASAKLDKVVFWLRAPTPPGAARLRLWQRQPDRRDTILGEVTL